MTRLSFHASGEDADLMIFACRRSGSTWLMELLASAPRLRFVNEPDIQSLIYEAELPTGLENHLPPELRKIVDVPIGSEDAFRRHFMDPRSTRIRGPYNLCSPQYHVFTTRRVIKIVHATAIADWIGVQHWPLHSIYLVRHPIATALSMMRSNVTCRAVANLRHPGFCAKMGSALTDFAWDILREGSALDRFVLEWCLDNLVPFRSWRSGVGNWSFLTYEELLLDPSRSLGRLGAEVDLIITPSMLRLAGVPSASTTTARRPSLLNESASEAVTRWTLHIDRRREERAFAIVDTFGFDLYGVGRSVATDRYLHFQETPRI